MDRAVIRPIVVSVLALGVAGPAFAYSYTGSFWTWQGHPIEDTFSLDASTFPADAGSAAEIEDAFTYGMDTWNALGRDGQLVYDGVATGASLTADGFFWLQYGSYSGIGGALAFTSAWSWDDGAAFDCDVYVLDANDYGAIYWDTDPAGPASGRYDLYSVATHELGHCLGLDHSADSSAVMYAYYSGTRSLAADDVAGLEALYGPACEDADGDGYRGCDVDCDDANAAIHPGAAEVCDGVDGDCDGIVDAQDELDAELAHGGGRTATGWAAGGNAFRVDSPTALVRATDRLIVTEGARLVWSVHRSDDGGATWSLVRTEIAYATADPTQTSPDMNQPLDVGAMYAVSLGALDGTETFSFDATPSLAAIGPITPIGGVYGRSLGDDISTPDATYLFGQTLTLIAPADPDGDGQTALCGDCAPDDVTVFTGATESCDGLDDDCDGAVDEGFASDTDGDGTIDCLDACPHDPADDADGDGACADVDPCPEDPTDACGDTSADDTGPDDTGPDDTGPDDTDADTDADADADADGDTDSDTDADTDADTGRDTPPGGKAETRSGCACSGAPSPFGAWALGLAALVLMRRRGAR